MVSGEGDLFRKARELIVTSKELIKKTKELLRNSDRATPIWKNNKTPEETRVAKDKPR